MAILGFLYWLVLTVAIIACGAVVGAISFPIGGIIFGYEMEIRAMIHNGILDGGFYAMIWAPGISFVVCIMILRKKSGRISNNES